MVLREAIIDKIVEYSLENASRLFLELEGEFYPFGVIMDSDNSVSPYYVKGDNEFPDSNDVISDLRESLKQYLGSYSPLGAGICYLASKKVSEVEFDLVVVEIFFSDNSPKEIFWFIIEIDEKSHTFKVHEKIDYGRM